MPQFEIGPLPLALVASILGSMLLVWHRHGGARWMFVLGGFLFIVGRLMIAAICAFLLFVVVEATLPMDSELVAMGTILAVALLGIGGWSLFAIFRVVRRDAFGAAQQEAARVRYTDRHS